jgi:hypothetical protein
MAIESYTSVMIAQLPGVDMEVDKILPKCEGQDCGWVIESGRYKRGDFKGVEGQAIVGRATSHDLHASRTCAFARGHRADSSSPHISGWQPAGLRSTDQL